MSYNIKGHGTLTYRRHIGEIARVIVEAKPDVAGLQEVHRGGWKARSQDQIAELERLTGMTAVFGRSMGDERSEFGNGVLTRGKVLDTVIHPLPGSGEPRTLLSVTIDADGFVFRAFVTHLAAWGRFGAAKRLEQARRVAAIVEQSDLPFLLTGDFNSVPTSAELEVFHSGRIVVSCFLEPVVTYRATRQCLDYIFVQRGWVIRSASVLQHGPSDHWPVLAEVLPPGQ